MPKTFSFNSSYLEFEIFHIHANTSGIKTGTFYLKYLHKNKWLLFE
jgi:hypothetical protein